MKKIIAVLAGDGIGQELMPYAIRVLNRISEKFNHNFVLHEALIGGAAFEQHQSHFPQETKLVCEQADAVLLGAVGGPSDERHFSKWTDCEKNSILALRKVLQLNINLRPIHLYAELAAHCPVKARRVQGGIDMLIVRELIGDIYFGEHYHGLQHGQRYARDVAEYSEEQIKAAAHQAFQCARQRRKKVTSVDKANVLATSKLWRDIMTEVSRQYSDVYLEHMLVDNCAMQLILNPTQFDVIVTANLFGDILSDEAAALVGGLGLIASASLHLDDSRAVIKGLYEPAGGSAPDIAFKNVANPIAQILSVAMLLRYSFARDQEAQVIETAIHHALSDGFRTQDIYDKDNKNHQRVSTSEMVAAILQYI